MAEKSLNEDEIRDIVGLSVQFLTKKKLKEVEDDFMDSHKQEASHTNN